MPKRVENGISLHTDIHRDRLILVAAYSERLRYLASSLYQAGRSDLHPVLMDVAAEMQAIAHQIVATGAGLEIVLRAGRLIDAAETLVARLGIPDTVH
jgi:hypothetical protein